LLRNTLTDFPASVRLIESQRLEPRVLVQRALEFRIGHRSLFATPTCVRRAHLARLRHDIDDGWLAGLDDVDGSVKRRAELLRLRNRAEAFDAQGSC
jgi:hypothetical protein